VEQWLVLAAVMLATGCVAGVLAGLFGIGGGIVIVPVLEAALGMLGVDPAIRMHIAVATSLATIIPTSISSARAHHKRGAVDIAIVKRWAIFILSGALLGAWIASQLHSSVLAIVFATLAFLVALKMIFAPAGRNLTDGVPRGMWVPVIPTFIGCASSMMGIGGGTFSVMALTLFNEPIHRAIGTAALFGLVISLPGTVGFIVSGYGDPRLPPGSFGYVNLLGVALIAPTTVLAAPLGAKIAHAFSARRLSLLFGIFLLIAAGKLALAADELQPDPPFDCYSCAEWNQPQAPFHIFGNTYYVGVAGISVILIDAGTELILIDGGLPQSAALVVAGIRDLGFEPRDISTIVLSHAHYDHAGGIAALQRLSGARVLASSAGALALQRGDLLEDDPLFAHGYENRSFPAVATAEVVENELVRTYGSVRLRGIHTPGHTPGGMSWTGQSCEEDRCLNIVYADSLSPVSAAGYRFSDGLGDAVRRSSEIVAALDCDILLVTHPVYFDMQRKFAQGRETFIDMQACSRYAANTLQQLEQRLADEQAEQSP
jgi:uncharacterized membrane protein YfcA